VMCGLYLLTVKTALQSPLNKGSEFWWVRRWILFAVIVVLSQFLVRRRLVTLIWLGVGLAAALCMIAWSQQITATLITAAILLFSWAWGDWALRKMQAPSSGRILEGIAVAVPLGLAMTGLLTLVLNMTRLLSPPRAALIFSVLTLLQWRSLSQLAVNCHRWLISKRPLNAQAPITPEDGTIAVFMAALFLLDLAWALAPEIHYDALNVHLPMARFYVDHPIALTPYAGLLSNLVHMLFALGVSLQGPGVAKLISLAAGVLSTLGVYSLGRMFFNTRVGLWAAALFFTTPVVSWISTTAYLDTTITMFLLAALLAFFRWQEERAIGWLRAAGLLTGAAIAAKWAGTATCMGWVEFFTSF